MHQILFNGPYDAEAEYFTEEFAEQLLAEAEIFRRAGGVITSADHKTMGDPEYTALIEAGEKIQLEQAVLIGMASQSREAAARMHAPLDGGDGVIEVELDKSIERTQQTLEKRTTGV